MPGFTLNSDQKRNLRTRAKEFVTWLQTDEGTEEVRDHREHEAFFKEKLSELNIKNLTEEGLGEVWKELWASKTWRNKEWYIENRLLAPNGLDTIKKELSILLYGPGDPAGRFDKFRSKVKGFGTSSLSEILHTVFPDKFCLWNEKPKTVLPFLGLEILPERFFNSQITKGEEYMQCVSSLTRVREELSEFGVRDFIDLDLFFWHLYRDVMPSEEVRGPPESRPQPPEIAPKIESHEGAEYYLLELGQMLGFATYTADPSRTYSGTKLREVAMLERIPPFAGERDLDSARLIDVIWFGEDENPKLCFEVEHSMDVGRALNRLFQLQHINVKFFVVGPEEKRSKFNREMRKFPYRRLEERYRFMAYEELASLFEAASPFHELKTRLLGTHIVP